jgi:CBS domain containing-hemolysin-like protein
VLGKKLTILLQDFYYFCKNFIFKVFNLFILFMIALLSYLLLALSLSFICSLFEAVLLSTPISFVNMLEAEGDKKASQLKRLKENVDKPLSAILSINTVAHTIGAAGVGAQAVTLFGEVYFGVISAILTFLILIFSEIIPKVIGANYWRRLALPIVPWLNALIVIAYPFVLLSEFFSKIISRGKSETTVSREEVFAMAVIATEEGEFEVSENIIIQNLQKLEFVKVEDVMTPQIVVSIAREEMTVAEFYKNKDFLHYARIPVYADGNEDHITGYVLRQKVLEQLANDNFSIKLSDIKRGVISADEGESIMKLWERLLHEKEHIAIVTDEYGSFNGIVTLEDIIESILGLEIVDETDQFTDMQQYARQKWNERREKYKHISTSENTDKSS